MDKYLSNKPVTKEERQRLTEMLAGIEDELKMRGILDHILIQRASTLLKKHYSNRRRHNGDPWMVHNLQVADILAKAGFGMDLVLAGLMHDTIQFRATTYKQLKDRFSPSVADIIADFTEIYDQEEKVDDEELKKKTKAFYVRIADRIHNLQTIDIPAISKKHKAEYIEETQKTMIPKGMQLGVYSLLDILEPLCFQKMHPDIYEGIHASYQKMRESTKVALSELKAELNKCIGTDPELVFIRYVDRHEASIYRHLRDTFGETFVGDNKEAQLVSLEHVEICDINIIVQDSLLGNEEALFMRYYEKLHESEIRLTITGISKTMESGQIYYKMVDRFGYQYRVFMQTVSDHRRYMFGETENIQVHMPVDSEMQEESVEMITVYRKDGSEMQIKKGATVLDFAFELHKDIGLCATGARINEGKIVRLDTVLNEHDQVLIFSDHYKNPKRMDVQHANFRWIEYVHTKKAKKALARYFEVQFGEKSSKH